MRGTNMAVVESVEQQVGAAGAADMRCHASTRTEAVPGPAPGSSAPVDGAHQLLDEAVLQAVDDAVHVEGLAVGPGALHHRAGAHLEHLLLHVELAQPAEGRGVGGRGVLRA
jgi:hypothetical protein